jgi:hypothetical protein
MRIQSKIYKIMRLCFSKNKILRKTKFNDLIFILFQLNIPASAINMLICQGLLYNK